MWRFFNQRHSDNRDQGRENRFLEKSANHQSMLEVVAVSYRQEVKER